MTSAVTPPTGTPTTSASYTYDSRGFRKSKTVNGTTTYYITDAEKREFSE